MLCPVLPGWLNTWGKRKFQHRPAVAKRKPVYLMNRTSITVYLPNERLETDLRTRSLRSLASSAQPSRLDAMDHRNPALAATCHCGAIRIIVRRISRTLTSCNCSICRRYGALWAYYAASSVTIEAPKGGLSKYSWNQRIRDYYRCKKCGCVTHYEYRKKRRNTIVAVNAVNFEPSALVGVRIRHLDGAVSWKFFD
jgi:hypothetical protein